MTPELNPNSTLQTLTEGTLADKLYRLEHLYKIRTKEKTLIPFKLNNIQRRIYDTIQGQSPVRQFDLKYRQGGVSTFWLLWWLDETMFNPNTVSGVLADSWENLERLWRIVEIAYENVPKEWRPLKRRDQAHRLEFQGTNSEIFISLRVRSTGLHNLHVSEACYCEEEELMVTLGSVSPSTNISIESTANGVGNQGYTLYTEGKKGLNGFRSYFYPWFIQDEYALPLNGLTVEPTGEEKKVILAAKRDYGIEIKPEQLLWRRESKKVFRERFAQEFPSNDEEAFLRSGGRFFEGRKMLALLEEAKEWKRMHPPVASTEDFDQWEEPDPDSNYVAGADVAEGWGDGDYSVLTILNRTKAATAFRYRAKVGIDVFYRICDEWGRKFNNAWMAIEKNNHGHAVLQGLIENCRYPNLYHSAKAKRYKEPTTTIFDPSDRLHRAGWVTDAQSKPMMLDALKTALEGASDSDVEHFESLWSVPDVLLLEETLTFVQEGSALGAERGAHDDLIMSYGIANELYRQAAPDRNTAVLGIRVGDLRKATTDGPNPLGDPVRHQLNWGQAMRRAFGEPYRH